MAATLSTTELHAYLVTAQRIADRVDGMLMAEYGTGMAAQKSDGSLVTQADRDVDAYITRELQIAHPHHLILSEECNTVYASNQEFAWVIDPLDGTTNFARSIPIWGVSIALLYRGEPIVGVLSFCLLRERYVAIRDGGAQRNGVSIHTATHLALDNQHLLMLCTRTLRRYTVTSPLKHRILGSAAYHIASVANGSALAGIEATPKLWDIAAALLILTETGGCYSTLNGQDSIFPLNVAESTDFARISFPLLTAANSQILREMKQHVVHKS
jgi:myo-inositol-1(or 4)-monophosphatase